jgi:hypothetical protein
VFNSSHFLFLFVVVIDWVCFLGEFVVGCRCTVFVLFENNNKRDCDDCVSVTSERDILEILDEP